jgi:hypothetical protein
VATRLGLPPGVYPTAAILHDQDPKLSTLLDGIAVLEFKM